MPKLRVLVVEDSLTVRRRLCEVLGSDPDIEIVGEAEDGRRAIELCQALRPNVVTLDMLLPNMTGLEATEYIMAHCPTPILIVSSSTNRGDLFKMYDALAAGAVDVLEKPSDKDGEGVWERKFLAAVKMVARIRVITHPRARLSAASARPPLTASTLGSSPGIVALGASTGGPSALVTVLRALPTDLSLPTVVVLHIDEPFSAAFADWLSDQTPHRVATIRGDEEVTGLAGRVLLAPPNRHTVVRRGVLRLTNDPERNFCRPSIDVLFESLAVEFGNSAIACLLTGMGKDGARGLLAIRKAGGYTIAQDEATSIVYGMPREAAELGAALRVLPLLEIGEAVRSIARNRR